MAYKLSICIPTYNRADSLGQLLGQICPMVVSGGYSQDIEICVSDNGSDDATPEILQTYAADFDFLTIRRNDTNLGFGRNLWQAAEMASGQYIYFTGDDDAFHDDALDSLMTAVDCGAGLVLLNSHSSAGFRKDLVPAGEIIPIETLERYLELTGIFHASFIGNLMFERTAFQESCKIGDALFLSAYPHLFPVFRIMRQGECRLANFPITKPDDSARSWIKLQPVYSSVDVAGIARGEVCPFVTLTTRLRLMLGLMRSLPRAYARLWSGAIKVDRKNPYQSLHLPGIIGLYVLGVCGKNGREIGGSR